MDFSIFWGFLFLKSLQILKFRNSRQHMINTVHSLSYSPQSHRVYQVYLHKMYTIYINIYYIIIAYDKRGTLKLGADFQIPEKSRR